MDTKELHCNYSTTFCITRDDILLLQITKYIHYVLLLHASLGATCYDYERCNVINARCKELLLNIHSLQRPVFYSYRCHKVQLLTTKIVIKDDFLQKRVSKRRSLHGCKGHKRLLLPAMCFKRTVTWRPIAVP